MRYAKPIYQRDIIKGARQRFLEQYKRHPDSDVPGWDRSRTFGQVRAALAALDLETCTSGDVDKAIGVTGWGDNNCDECGGNFPVLIRLGYEPDYDSRWWDLCRDCLNKATTFAAETALTAGSRGIRERNE